MGTADDDRAAEEVVLSNLERRREKERLSLAWRREAEAERDLLPSIPSEASEQFQGVATSAEVPHARQQLKTKPAIARAAHRVMHLNRVKRIQEAIGDEDNRKKTDELKTSTTVSPFLDIAGTHRLRGSCADMLFDELQRVEVMQRDTHPKTHEDEEAAVPEDRAATTSSPFFTSRLGISFKRSTRSNGRAMSKGLGVDIDEEAGEKTEDSPLLPPSESRHRGLMLRFRSVSTARSIFRDILSPGILCKNSVHFLITRFLLIMLPCLIAAYLLFRYGNNFELQFLPTDASLSWWLIFFVRQLVTLQLAICTEYIVVDAFAQRSPIAPRLMGPLLTLYTLQAKGWPFMLSSWGIWDLLLLHGTGAFARNWLFFLNIGMFSDANNHGGVIAQDLYLRILVSVVVVGISVGIKRTYLALYLGRRTFSHYKGKLEQLLANMLLISEVADLAHLTELKAFEEALAHDLEVEQLQMPSTLKTSKKWEAIRFKDDSTEVSTCDSSLEEIEPTDSKSSDANTRTDERTAGKVDYGASGLGKSSFPAQHRHQDPTSSSSSMKIKDLLDTWEEPQSKGQKDECASIHDILQFRKALSYMDDSHPFSDSFGPSNTRDSCVRSAQKVYARLLKFAPESEVLPFEVIGALAYADESGNISIEKKNALRTLFRPDRNDQITMVAFVQTCDWVYKKLRFFRASVANSSSIDQVLEQIFNFFFYIILALVIISGVMDLDPWSLLVSISTLLVSFSFAVGASISKCIEGILLIAIRRPYDLGDRISFCPADAVNIPDGSSTWFVEDVNLFTTTLRLAATNEVSSVNNGAIANARIHNFARSPGAFVSLQLLFAIEATDEQVEKFKQAVKQYIRDNPRTWNRLVNFRLSNIDPDMEYKTCSILLQHMKSWQEMMGVFNSRGELEKFCIGAMEQLGVVYDNPGRTVNINMQQGQSLPEISQGGMRAPGLNK